MELLSLFQEWHRSGKQYGAGAVRAATHDANP